MEYEYGYIYGGLFVLGSMLIQVHWGIIIFLITTTVISYYLNQKIIAWTAANNKERIGYQQRLHYINDISGDIRSEKIFVYTKWLYGFPIFTTPI